MYWQHQSMLRGSAGRHHGLQGYSLCHSFFCGAFLEHFLSNKYTKSTFVKVATMCLCLRNVLFFCTFVYLYQRPFRNTLDLSMPSCPGVQVIYTQPSDLGFGAVARRRAFTAFVRRDAGKFIGEPQQIYNILTASLRDRQLSIEKLTELTSDLEVEADRKVLKRNCDPNSFLTKCEAANKARYEELYDEKNETTLADQCFVLNQNADKRPKQSKDGALPLFTRTDRITWLRQRGRHLTALEKMLGHGWPMTQELACLLNLPVA